MVINVFYAMHFFETITIRYHHPELKKWFTDVRNAWLLREDPIKLALLFTREIWFIVYLFHISALANAHLKRIDKKRNHHKATPLLITFLDRQCNAQLETEPRNERGL